MKSPEEMEQALKRLMPAAVSDRAQQGISQMISSLASAQSTAPVVVAEATPPSTTKRSWYRPLYSWSAAAALAIGALISLSTPAVHSLGSAQQALAAEPLPAETSPVFIDRMELTDGMILEGTIASADGTMMNKVKRRVETRERYRDKNKGYLITISESRDVQELVPKTSF